MEIKVHNLKVSKVGNGEMRLKVSSVCQSSSNMSTDIHKREKRNYDIKHL